MDNISENKMPMDILAGKKLGAIYENSGLMEGYVTTESPGETVLSQLPAAFSA